MALPWGGRCLRRHRGEFAAGRKPRREFSFDQKEAYLKAYADRMRPAITDYLAGVPQVTEDLLEPFRAYFQRLGEMNEYFRERVDMNLRFVVQGSYGGDFLVKCTPRKLTVERTEGQSAQYTTYLDAIWLNQILHLNLAWEDFLLSLRFSAERDPDVYNDHLLSWLKFA